MLVRSQQRFRANQLTVRCWRRSSCSISCPMCIMSFLRKRGQHSASTTGALECPQSRTTEYARADKTTRASTFVPYFVEIFQISTQGQRNTFTKLICRNSGKGTAQQSYEKCFLNTQHSLGYCSSKYLMQRSQKQSSRARADRVETKFCYSQIGEKAAQGAFLK